MPCTFLLQPVPEKDIGFDHLAEGVVHASVEIQFGSYRTGVCALRHRGIKCPEIDRCTETASSVGAGAYPALHLQGTDSACHIGEVDPEDRLALRIIERHFVDGHVDACLVGSAHMEIRVSYSQTVIGSTHQRRRDREQIRQVLTGVVPVQLCVFHLLLAVDGLHYRRTDDYLLKGEVIGGEGVLSGNLRSTLRGSLRTQLRRRDERHSAHEHQPCMADT